MRFQYNLFTTFFVELSISVFFFRQFGQLSQHWLFLNIQETSAPNLYQTKTKIYTDMFFKIQILWIIWEQCVYVDVDTWFMRDVANNLKTLSYFHINWVNGSW